MGSSRFSPCNSHSLSGSGFAIPAPCRLSHVTHHNKTHHTTSDSTTHHPFTKTQLIISGRLIGVIQHIITYIPVMTDQILTTQHMTAQLYQTTNPFRLAGPPFSTHHNDNVTTHGVAVGPRLAFIWYGYYKEPSGGATAKFAWQAEYSLQTQNLLEELLYRRARLGRASCGKHFTKPFE